MGNPRYVIDTTTERVRCVGAEDHVDYAAELQSLPERLDRMDSALAEVSERLRDLQGWVEGLGGDAT